MYNADACDDCGKPDDDLGVCPSCWLLVCAACKERHKLIVDAYHPAHDPQV